MTPDQFILRYDKNRVADLLTTDTASPVDPENLSGDACLLALIDDACGEVDAAVTVGNKYTVDELEDLTGTSAAFLVRLCADLTWGYCLAFKGLGDADVKAQAPRYAEAKRLLEEIANGSMVFGVAASREAGLPFVTTPDNQLTNSPTLWNDSFGRFGYANGY